MYYVEKLKAKLIKKVKLQNHLIKSNNLISLSTHLKLASFKNIRVSKQSNSRTSLGLKLFINQLSPQA